MKLSRSLAAGTIALLAVSGLSACASSTTSTSAESPSASTSTACPITISDTWAKAAETGMTAAFGILANPSDTDVTVTAASSPAAARMELHEVVTKDGAMVMQPKEGGFTVPAGGTLTLEPGGFHLMLMDIPAAIEPGADVAITLTCSTGGTVEFTAQAKTFDGAAENYVGSTDGMSMSASPMAS